MSGFLHSRIFILNSDGTDRLAFCVPKGKDKILVGSDLDCDIRLNHPEIAEKHLSIYMSSTGKVNEAEFLSLSAVLIMFCSSEFLRNRRKLNATLRI
jgi:hypothetical protein